MTEHKKMYKAGKRWVVATLTVASIAVAGTTVNSQVAHADTVSGTETQQVSNDGNFSAPVTGTATQQAENTSASNASDDDNDPRIKVISGDMNKAARASYEKQAQEAQQQINEYNNGIEQLKEQQTKNEQAVTYDQEQINQGNQQLNQLRSAKLSKQKELHAQLEENIEQRKEWSAHIAELKSEWHKLYDVYQKAHVQSEKLYDLYFHQGHTELREEYNKANKVDQDAYKAFQEKQDAVIHETKTVELTQKGTQLSNQMMALANDHNPYLPEDKDKYEQAQKQVETYTTQLKNEQATKVNLASKISTLQAKLNNAELQLSNANGMIDVYTPWYKVEKKVTQTIIFNLPDGTQRPVLRVGTLDGIKRVPTNGPVSYEWSTSKWPAFTAPWNFGDEYIVPSVPAQTVYSNTPDQTITLSYTVAKDFAKENYGKLTSVIITPSNGSTMARLGLEGWHVADASRVLKYAYIIIKDQKTGEIVAETSYAPLASQDAQQAYPKIANSNQAKFSVVLNIPLKNLNDPLGVIARYTNGDSYDTGSLNADYSFGPIKADMGNHAWLDQCTFVNGKLHVAGWHATNQAPGATHTIILFDATRHCEIGRTTVGNDLRNDVQAVYPTIYNAGYSGFSTDFDVTPGMVGDQLQIVSRWSGNDTNTNYVDYWFPAKLMMSGEDNNAYLDQAKVINNHFTVAGWHATNQAAGRQYHTIILFDASQNRELTRISVTPAERADVARAFPQIFNAGESGFNVSFDLLPEMATDNIQIISRWSKSQDANTDYVDYWFAPLRLLTDDNKAALDGVSFANNQLQVAGWHAANQAVGRPYHTIIIFDASQHRELGRKTVSLTERNDVARAFPQIITAGKSGFNASFDLLPEMATDNIQIISRWSKSQDANTDYVDYWFAPQRLLTDQSNRAALDGVSSYNGKLVVAGWHATNQALGKQYHYIIIINPATGKEIARQLVNSGMARPDVRKAFPGVANADQSGFKVAFAPNTDLTQARQLTIISRWTDDQVGNGNYVDYWFAPVTRPAIQDNAGALESERYAWGTLGVTGWHATDSSLNKPYRTLILIDNTLHKEVAHQSISSVARPDIAKKYPNIAGAGNSGFDTHFKVNGADPTHDFTLISRYSATRDAKENCTDYDFHIGQLW
ncbi:KxYKxGKxW signal peptide domain-containing protein [Limosilactobacillus oris]|uniref:KxYKxGKxW signal peptide domain-containing protein n=1 Tax=Limosilactobacillus oris TaxID=1632 RepID=UPI0017494261|nr:KxYKxGKxW signal peptide domain-containing protein [Limosilactobacillus oris]